MVRTVLKAKTLLKKTLQNMLEKLKPEPSPPPGKQGKWSHSIVSFESLQIIF